MPQVVCLGIIVIDISARPVDEMPEKGLLEMTEQISIDLGGHATNSGRCLSILGVDVAVMGCVGQDELGDFAIEELNSRDVDTSGIYRTQITDTAVTLVLIDSSGERSFIHAIGANGQIRPEYLDMDLIKSPELLYMAGALAMPGFDGEPQAQVMAQAKQAGVTTVLDVVWDGTGKWLETLEPTLAYTDIFVPSVVEAREISGRQAPEDVAQFFLDQGIKIVGLTNAEQGAYVSTADMQMNVPAYEVEVVDTTGAGDAFTAGFIYGYLEGWDLERTTRFANAMGALATTAVGTTTGINSYQQVHDFLSQREPDYWR